MAKLIYNMLNTPTKGDTKTSAAKLGDSLSSEQLTIGDVLGDNVTGPVTVKSGTISSLSLSSPRVYRNGKTATVSDIANYDVIYYSKKSNAIWAYSQKISGLVENIAPNKEAPTSVTVSGITYQLPYYAAQRAFGIDGLEAGDTATLLLDKNGAVCDAYEASSLYESIIGVVTDVVTKSTTAADGTKKSAYYAKLLTLNGDTVEVEQQNDSTNLVGYAVTFDVSTSKMQRVSSAQATSGYIYSDSRLWGKSPIAQNIKILEMDDNGNILSVNLSRLDGVYLRSENVLLVSKNESGAIDGIIIKNVTGDTNKYGIITSIEKRTNNEGSLISYSYSYDLGGVRGSVSLRTTGLTQGPCVFKYKDGELIEATNLTRVENISLLTPSYISLKSGVKHRLSSGVLVYRIVDDTKILTTLDEALSYDGTIWAYYDKIQSEGGLVRVIYLK
ncbi:MAG: hypothetical protein IKU65_01270, partial [Oscillospiraceae bacterium]|nr:hypothetical protein [Oscillospiraceae bacterium]